MSFFRNKEIVDFLAVCTAITLCAAGVGMLFVSADCAVVVLLTGAALTTVAIVFTRRRYRRIFDFTAEIDSLLHSNRFESINDYSEGELAILQNETKKLLDRIGEQNEQLLSDKLFLSDSIADISHQLKTPLTSINLIVSLLSAPTISDTERTMLCKELVGLLGKIDWLIAALLKMSRLDARSVRFNNEKYENSKLIAKATEPLLVSLELHGQTLDVESSGSFCGDLAWTSEAICNIVKNCMEHSQGGDTIKIFAEETAIYNMIVIEDNGTGIDEADIPHIFERFYKGKNSGSKSVGIGLALAKMIINSQNGTVKAENKRSGGARFTIRFYTHDESAL